jgi:outer membrane immunogenic protein
MKKLLGSVALSLSLATPVMAADMPVKAAPAPAVVAVYNWSGFYFGGHVGGLRGQKDWAFVDVGGVPLAPPFPVTGHSVSGLIGGGQVGFNWQTGNIVFGVEAEGSWTDADGRSICPNPTARCESEMRWLASVAGRLGYAWNNVLLYAKGGWAWAEDRYFVRFPAAPALDEQTGNQKRSGWTVGFGTEIGLGSYFSFLGPNWSVKGEYMFADLGDKTATFTRIATGALVERARVDQQVHTFKFGVNYRFGWSSPVVARF